MVVSGATVRTMTIVGVVLLVMAAGIAMYRSVTVVMRAERLYAEAKRAVDRGDLDTARTKLIDVIKINPSFGNAKGDLAKVRQWIERGEKPTADGNGIAPIAQESSHGELSESRPAGGKSVPVQPGPQSSTRRNDALPAILSGYTLIDDTYGGNTHRLTFKPLGKERIMAALTLSVTRYDDPKRAVEELYALRSTYPMHQQVLMVNRHMAYYGDDGKGAALLAWAQDNELVMIEASSLNGTASGMLGAFLDAAAQL